MSEEHLDEQPAEKLEEKQPFPLAQSLSLGTGTFLAAGVIDLLAHLGPTGLVVGAIAAYVAARHGPEFVEQARKMLPSPDLDTHAERPEQSLQRSGSRSFIDRALGRFPKGYLAQEETEGLPPQPEDQEEVQEPPPSSSTGIGAMVIRAKRPEREVLLAPDLGLDIDDVIEAGVFVAGMKGSGKSSLAARLMEQLGRFPLPQIVYCLKGDFTSLVESHFTNGLVMTRQQLYDARTILSCCLQVVVDLRSWGTMEERAHVIASLNQALLQYAMALPEQLRVPWFVHLDEAQQFVSQQKPVGIEIPTWKWVTQSVTHLGILGRTYGAVPCLYTQRIADIHKDVISQQELRVFMKAALDNDLKRYEEYISAKTARRENIQAFRAGDAVVILPNGHQVITHFLQRESKHGSPTPHLTQALRLRHEHSHASAPASGTSASGSIPTMTERTSGFTFPPTVLRKASTNASPTGGFTAAIPARLARAQELYRPGMSHRDLARALGVDKETAIELMKQLKMRRLVRPEGVEWNTSAGEPAPQSASDRAQITVLPMRTEQRPQPTLNDAILCWNELVEAGQNPSRNNLQHALLIKGFDCKENWARKFYEDIKGMLKDQPKTSVGG
jgi:hypothetical protein